MNCTGKRCLAQYNKVDPATCTAVPYCPQATPPKTNADRIRNMTDDELAKWFCSMCNFGDFCPYQDDCDTNGSGILKWMKEEVMANCEQNREIRTYDNRRYMWQRKRIIEWHKKKPPKYRFISKWIWWRKRPFKWIQKEWEEP